MHHRMEGGRRQHHRRAVLVQRYSRRSTQFSHSVDSPPHPADKMSEAAKRTQVSPTFAEFACETAERSGLDEEGSLCSLALQLPTFLTPITRDCSRVATFSRAPIFPALLAAATNSTGMRVGNGRLSGQNCRFSEKVDAT